MIKPPADVHLQLAQRLADAYANQLRYVHGLGWHEWDGTRWHRELDGAPMRAAIATVKDARATMGWDLRRVETASGLRSILEIARVLHPLAACANPSTHKGGNP